MQLSSITNSRLNKGVTAAPIPDRRPGARSYVSKILFLGAIFYLGTVAFEGPIRYALSLAGLGSLIYIRDIFLVFSITIGVYESSKCGVKILNPLTISVYVVGLYFIFGVLVSDRSIFSSLFGVKVYLGVLAGMAMSRSITLNDDRFVGFIVLILFTSIAGVYANYAFGKFPWEGMDLETSFGLSKTTREWWSDGVRRIPGFTRASYDAAMVIGVCFAIWLPRLNRVSALFIGLLALVAVYMTTSKGTFVAMVFLIAWWSGVPGNSRRFTAQVILTFLLIIMVFLPLVSCWSDPRYVVLRDVPRFLASFGERIVDMWPRSCAILASPISWFTGAGFGSIGIPQRFDYFAKNLSSADNLFIYVYVTGGLIWATALVATCLKANFGRYAGNDWNDMRIASFLFLFLGNGITSNMLEQQFLSVMAGVFIDRVWRLKSTEERL